MAPPCYKILEFDASGQEFKWMAIASGDEKMLSLCVPGEDAHSYMTAKLKVSIILSFLPPYKMETKKLNEFAS